RRPALDQHSLVIAVSQSGETADTLAAMEEGARRGARIIALSNVVDASIPRKADAQLYMRCGPEVSVASTKCFTAEIEVLYLFALHLAARRGKLSQAQVSDLLAPVFSIPIQLESIFTI